MNQLTQNLKSGEMKVLEVPFPAMGAGDVLVRNYYSVISVGTEGKTVKDARLGYIGKARARQKEVKQVVESVKSNGLSDTYKRVMNKLDAPSPLGYSCAGEVIGVGEDITDIRVGDFVACAGKDANHAEVVAIPRNLVTKVPDGVDLKHAAFTTLASIAIQGIRQAELQFGEHAVVIGLGLIGQLTTQILQAAGVEVIGIDLEDRLVQMARDSGAISSLNRNEPDLEETVLRATNGHGTDAVIITAGTTSLDPVELAGVLCRRKGKVIIVGAVPTGFSRGNYYKKELELRMSTSYGPGRYDADYEEKGVDYPYGYVRWTENRNMGAYLTLLKGKKLNIASLISHEFEFDKVGDAYQMIVDKADAYTGIVLKYDVERDLKKTIVLKERSVEALKPGIGFIGAGTFAKNLLLPEASKHGEMIGVANGHGHSARGIADKYGFDFCTGEADEVLSNEKINTVFITTRHHLHATNVIKAIEAGKHVFVEKPLCLTTDEFLAIKKAYANKATHLMVGFNRRFAPQIKDIQKKLAKGTPRSILYRINAGKVAPDHWVHDSLVGGGRIIGEVCHFIDLSAFLAGSDIKSVAAQAITDPNGLNDTLTISLSFENGSIATIAYFSNGSKHLPKESLEVFYSGQVFIIDDFKKMTSYEPKPSSKRLKGQDKGHHTEVREFLKSITQGKPAPISATEVFHSTLATFAVIESIKTGQTILLDSFEQRLHDSEKQKGSDA